MLAEEGYIGVALDLFGVKAKLDGFEDYRRETSYLYKDRKEFRKRINSGLIEARNILGILRINLLLDTVLVEQQYLKLQGVVKK